MIEPEAAKFLIEHGFDFNKHLVEGVSYSKEERQVIKMINKMFVF